jgi:hypothetical protein
MARMPLHAIRCLPESPHASGLRRAFEGALVEALERIPGTWTARVFSLGPSSWTTVILERIGDGCRRTLVLAPDQQDPSYVTAELAEAFRDLALEGRVRGGRSPAPRP